MSISTKQFQKKVEQFVCVQCGTTVQGDGYTNHCPECFLSQHVDINPGDRAASCGGVMTVAALFLNHGNWVLRHRCQVCGFERNNKVQPNDNLVALARLQQQLIGQIT